MKRIANLYPDIISFENLLIANKKAFRGSNKSNDAIKFQFNLENELILLKNELYEKKYFPGKYRYFKIYDPKERLISVAPYRDRVVHHALIKIIEPVFEKIFIYDSYATRKDKGTHKAVLRAQRFMRHNKYYLKFDVKKYFESISHNKLLEIISRKIKCKDTLELNERIIRNGGNNGKGLPIGNLTSQFHANVYLNIFDHFVKETLKCKFYIRYMDDCLIFSNDKPNLKKLLELIRNFLNKELSLNLKEKATLIGACHEGLSFLGMRIFKNYIRFKGSNFRRSIKKIKLRNWQYKQGFIDFEKFLMSMTSIYGYAGFYNIKLPNLEIP